jgi:hypothetical protein
MRVLTRTALVGLLGASLLAPQAASAATIGGGSTTLTTDPATTAALVGAGIAPTPAGRATAAASGASVAFTFPVTGGFVNLQNLGGKVWHAGGITFTNTATGAAVTVSRFVIDTRAAQLTALLERSRGTRTSILDLNLSGVTVTPGPSGVVVGNVTASLTSGAASALNAALGTSVFSAGLTIGTAEATLMP